MSTLLRIDQRCAHLKHHECPGFPCQCLCHADDLEPQEPPC